MATRKRPSAKNAGPGGDGNTGEFSVPYLRVAHRDAVFFVPRFATHRPAARKIMRGKLYEPQTHTLVARLLAARPGDMIHAGTFFGDMLPSFSRACQGTVHAFEPVFESYVAAKLCVQENALENVVLLNAALGACTGTARIDIGTETGLHRGGSSRLGTAGQLTSVLSIDGLGIADLRVLQLDVEGHELPALEGAAQTIAGAAPVILIEDNENACGDFLRARDYVEAHHIPGLTVWTVTSDLPDLCKLLNIEIPAPSGAAT